jgi:hypothetical protein
LIPQVLAIRSVISAFEGAKRAKKSAVAKEVLREEKQTVLEKWVKEKYRMPSR